MKVLLVVVKSVFTLLKSFFTTIKSLFTNVKTIFGKAYGEIYFSAVIIKKGMRDNFPHSNTKHNRDYLK